MIIKLPYKNRRIPRGFVGNRLPDYDVIKYPKTQNIIITPKKFYSYAVKNRVLSYINTCYI